MNEEKAVYGDLGIFKRNFQKIALDVLDEKISIYLLNTEKEYLSDLSKELSFHIASANELVFSVDMYKSFCGVMEESTRQAKFNLAKQIMLESIALSPISTDESYKHIVSLYRAKEIDILEDCRVILGNIDSIVSDDELKLTVITLGYYILIGVEMVEYTLKVIESIEKMIGKSDN